MLTDLLKKIVTKKLTPTKKLTNDWEIDISTFEENLGQYCSYLDFKTNIRHAAKITKVFPHEWAFSLRVFKEYGIEEINHISADDVSISDVEKKELKDQTKQQITKIILFYNNIEI